MKYHDQMGYKKQPSANELEIYYCLGLTLYSKMTQRSQHPTKMEAFIILDSTV